MSDQIILLEERKEVTTFILDDGDITETEVVTATGKSPGYDYSAKIHLGDTVTISEKSKIGKECMKLYTGGDEEIPMGIIVNDPVVMSGGIRKASVLMLGQLFRLKLDEESEDNINVNDRLTLTTHNVVLSAQGEYYALHPVLQANMISSIPSKQVVEVVVKKGTLEILDQKAIQVIQGQ